jgi:hypothetical protein
MSGCSKSHLANQLDDKANNTYFMYYIRQVGFNKTFPQYTLQVVCTVALQQQGKYGVIGVIFTITKGKQNDLQMQ